MLKLFLLISIILFIFIRRKTLSVGITFILIWLSFAVFNALFAQRPYTHYLLVLLPSFSLFLGFVSLVLKKQTNTIYEKKARAAVLVLFVFLIFIVLKNFNLYDKTISYYGNFLSFVQGNKNTTAYYAFFDRNTPKDYQVAQFIIMNTTIEDKIFLWGNNAQIYKMTNKLPPGRFTVAYHMTAKKETLDETKNDLQKQNPKFIIISHQAPLPFAMTGYSQRINIEETSIYERTNR